MSFRYPQFSRYRRDLHNNNNTTNMATVSWLGKNAAKIALGAGAVYFTINQGVMGSSSSDGTKALQRLSPSGVPSIFETFEKVPSLDEIERSTKQTWNSGVQKVFGGIVNLPETTTDYSKKAVKYSMDFVKK